MYERNKMPQKNGPQQPEPPPPPPPPIKTAAMLNSKIIMRRARKAKLTRKSVLKMLAVMEASQNTGGGGGSSTSGGANPPPPTPEGNANAQDFLSSGRTGRRNALPDILGQHAAVTSSDLPARLQALTTKDKTGGGGDANKSTQRDEPSTSKS